MIQKIALSCPCSSQKPYAACCEPIIHRQKMAETPEALMRSRYTAFTQANVDHLFSSMAPELAQHVDRAEIQAFAESVEKWTGLEISDVSPITPEDTQGMVEFIAHFFYEGKAQRIHERSTFIKIDGQWFYHGHEHQCSSPDHNDHHAPHRHQPPDKTRFKIGRNDPCPCGSGKKYKKCCLNNH